MPEPTPPACTCGPPEPTTPSGHRMNCPDWREGAEAASSAAAPVADPVDSRLAELANLTPGWLDGHGQAIPAETILLAGQLANALPEHLHPISIYPTEPGGIELEWRDQHGTHSIEIAPDQTLFLLSDERPADQPTGPTDVPTDPGLRKAIADALRAAAGACGPDCSLPDEECVRINPIREDATTFSVISDIHGPIDAITDAVVAVVQPALDQLAHERDLAIAHDRQPYPTAWAYEQACKALEKHRDRAETAEAEVAENVGVIQALRRQRDQAEAALARVRALHHPVTWPAEPPAGARPEAAAFDAPVTVCAADSDDPQGRTYWTPWPCDTTRALDADEPAGSGT